MKHCIVPVFSQQDLEALPNCLRYLAQQPVETLLVLHGPNVGVVNADATKEFDAKIASLETRKKELVLVDDYDGAKRAKEEAEKLRVERDMKIRDGWKTVPEDQRKAAYAKAFANLGTEPICLREAYQSDQLFSMLQSYLPQFPSDIPHGEYAIIWPRSVATFIKSSGGLSLPHDGPRVADLPIKGGTFPHGAGETTGRGKRESELKGMHHIKAIAIAREAGIPVKGRKVADVIQDLLAKEFPAQAQAA